jgi:hypothetical protein
MRDEYPPFRLDRYPARATSTGRLVWCRTPVDTLPSSVAASVERPREPSTIAAASRSSAQATSAAKTAPELRSGSG